MPHASKARYGAADLGVDGDNEGGERHPAGERSGGREGFAEGESHDAARKQGASNADGERECPDETKIVADQLVESLFAASGARFGEVADGRNGQAAGQKQDHLHERVGGAEESELLESGVADEHGASPPGAEGDDDSGEQGGNTEAHDLAQDIAEREDTLVAGKAIGGGGVRVENEDQQSESGRDDLSGKSAVEAEDPGTESSEDEECAAAHDGGGAVSTNAMQPDDDAREVVEENGGGNGEDGEPKDSGERWVAINDTGDAMRSQEQHGANDSDNDGNDADRGDEDGASASGIVDGVLGKEFLERRILPEAGGSGHDSDERHDERVDSVSLQAQQASEHKWRNTQKEAAEQSAGSGEEGSTEIAAADLVVGRRYAVEHFGGGG